MGSHNELKEINIKNHTCSHFDEMIKIEDFDFNNALWDEKSYVNVLIDDIWQKTLIGARPLCIRFDKIDGIFRV